MTTAIFTGSFDPFTIGHEAIVRQALPLFDRIVIGVGVNGNKTCLYDPQTRVEAIARLYAGETKVEVRQYDDLTVDFARREGARYIIKGVRSVKDYEYERDQADINRMLDGVETVLFLAAPGMEGVSSSMVRELMRFGRDASRFLPKAPDSK